MVQLLLKNGYTFREAITLTLSDIEMFNEILDEDLEEQGLTEDFLSQFM